MRTPSIMFTRKALFCQRWRPRWLMSTFLTYSSILLFAVTVVFSLYEHLMSRCIEHDPPLFATFAFTENSGGRWSTETCKHALQVQYSSLVKSQRVFPHLYLYTDNRSVIPKRTFSGLDTRISAVITSPGSFPQNAYADVDPWRSLSRSKLDIVEKLIHETGKRIIWIDLDTLVFTDLSIADPSSWVVGYQHGFCSSGNCSAEHKNMGGYFDRNIEPRFDAFGDLWALDRPAIHALREYENLHISRGQPLPLYDLQGYFTLMLQDRVLPASLLHEHLDSNFGFACSRSEHPTPWNMELYIMNNTLKCHLNDLEGIYSERVGSISFTAPTFQSLFPASSELDFSWIADEEVRKWFRSWFLS